MRDHHRGQASARQVRRQERELECDFERRQEKLKKRSDNQLKEMREKGESDGQG
jgi:hypothetical protein